MSVKYLVKIGIESLESISYIMRNFILHTFLEHFKTNLKYIQHFWQLKNG
jgi:hypothetical protein